MDENSISDKDTGKLKIKISCVVYECLRSEVPLCPVNQDYLPPPPPPNVFTLTVDIENPFNRFEDIHQEILFAKFDKNMTLSGLIQFRRQGVSGTENWIKFSW